MKRKFLVGVLLTVLFLTSCSSDIISINKPNNKANNSDISDSSNSSNNTSSTKSFYKAMPLIYTEDDYKSPNNIEEAILNVSSFSDLNAVEINIYENNKLSGYGSGAIYNYDENEKLYYVLTNTHVISDASKIEVKTSLETVDAEIVGYSSNQDVGVVRFKSNNTYNLVKISKDEAVKKGLYVVAVGTPISTKYFNNLSVGNISNISDNEIKHTASLNSGNSGGPLYNLNCELVGLNNSKISGSTSSGASIEDMYFAVSISAIEEGISDINRVVLGVSSYLISQIKDYSSYSNYEAYSLDKTRKGEGVVNQASWNKFVELNKNIPDGVVDGLYVSEITSGSVAEGKILVDDIIIEADGVSLKEFADLKKILDKKSHGDIISLKLYRNKELKDVEVTL